MPPDCRDRAALRFRVFGHGISLGRQPIVGVGGRGRWGSRARPGSSFLSIPVTRSGGCSVPITPLCLPHPCSPERASAWRRHPPAPPGLPGAVSPLTTLHASSRPYRCFSCLCRGRNPRVGGNLWFPDMGLSDNRPPPGPAWSGPAFYRTAGPTTDHARPASFLRNRRKICAPPGSPGRPQIRHRRPGRRIRLHRSRYAGARRRPAGRITRSGGGKWRIANPGVSRSAATARSGRWSWPGPARWCPR